MTQLVEKGRPERGARRTAGAPAAVAAAADRRAARATARRRLRDAMLASAASGVLYALAFAPFGAWPLAFAAFVPLFVAVQSVGRGTAALCGFCCGAVSAGISGNWMFSIFGPFAVPLLGLYAGYFALAAALVRAATAAFGAAALVWAAPVVWVAVEWLRSETWWLKFSWFTVGSSQHANLALLQTGSWWGAYGLSLVLVAANGALALGVARRRWLPPIVAAAAIAALHGAGASLLDREEPDFPVALIEGEHSPVPEFLSRIDAAMARAPQTKLVVLPEYTTFDRLDERATTMRLFAAAAKRHRVTLVFGGKRAVPDAGASEFENTLFVLGPDGTLAGTQAKSVPVPFFGDGLPARTRTPVGPFGCALCYDLGFPFVSADLVAAGAQLLVFPTMDASWWGAVQHRQHAELAALRAVEHRRWLVRAASSGVTLIADPWGRVVEGRGILYGAVRQRAERTLYSRFGRWLPVACALATLLLLAAAFARARLTRAAAASRSAS